LEGQNWPAFTHGLHGIAMQQSGNDGGVPPHLWSHTDIASTRYEWTLERVGARHRLLNAVAAPVPYGAQQDLGARRMPGSAICPHLQSIVNPRQALTSGARGFLANGAPSTALADVVRRVHEGHRYVDPILAADALTAAPSPLTPREAEVLPIAQEDRPICEIARALFLSPGTSATTSRPSPRSRRPGRERRHTGSPGKTVGSDGLEPAGVAAVARLAGAAALPPRASSAAALGLPRVFRTVELCYFMLRAARLDIRGWSRCRTRTRA
jgi:hypothetical protein